MPKAADKGITTTIESVSPREICKIAENISFAGESTLLGRNLVWELWGQDVRLGCVVPPVLPGAGSDCILCSVTGCDCAAVADIFRCNSRNGDDSVDNISVASQG